MDRQTIQKTNILLILAGFFFLVLGGVIVSFFMPYFLKEEGLNILEIGFILTIGLAFGSLITSVLFSYIQKRIKLKTGLVFSTILGVFSPLVLFIFPNAQGVFSSQFLKRAGVSVQRISTEVAIQHNTSKKTRRSVSANYLIIEALSMVFGMILSVACITYLGFRWTFLVFALFSVFPFVFFSRINEETRFRPRNPSSHVPRMSHKLKLFVLSEIIYNFALSASFALVITFLVIDRFAGSLVWLAALFTALYLTITIVTQLTKKRLKDVDLVKTTILGMAILLLSAVVIVISTNLYVVLAAMILEGIGAGIWVPAMNAYQWESTKPSQREIISGYIEGRKQFLKTLAPLVGGWLAATFGIISPFYLKIVLALVCIGIYVYVLGQK